jgi:hypothetical protein
MSKHPKAADYPITDGFLYNTLLRPNLDYLPLVLSELEALRRSGAYRTHWLCIPQDSFTTPIPADDSYEYQCSVLPGSIYWGWTFVSAGGEKDEFSIQITDGCSDVPLWSETVSTAAVVSPTSNTGGQLAPGQGKQNIFCKPIVIGKPGIVNVQICSLHGSAVNQQQLIIYGAQPVPVDQCEAA